MSKISPLLIAVALCLFGCATIPDNVVRTPPHPALKRRGDEVIGRTIDRDLLASLTVEYINLFRSKHNLTLLTRDQRTADAAGWMADYQSRVKKVTHIANTSGWNKLGDRYRRSGGGEYVAGYENASWSPLYEPSLGRNHTYDEMARIIVDGWINSPEHFKNLLPEWDGARPVVGVGIAGGQMQDYDGIFATMDLFMIGTAPIPVMR
ncbi:MAG: CAP domain-containing protein [Candidatus Kapaibacterium sp.]